MDDFKVEIFNGLPGPADDEERLAARSLCFVCLHSSFLPPASPARFSRREIDKARGAGCSGGALPSRSTSRTWATGGTTRRVMKHDIGTRNGGSKIGEARRLLST